MSLAGGFLFLHRRFKPQNYGAPPYVEDEGDNQDLGGNPDYSNWQRPVGPLRVGLQAGHWQNEELPEELARLKTSGGTSSGEIAEWEVNLNIAEETKKLLEKEGIVVDILPATIPPAYLADAFVAIHADGSTDRNQNGFKVAAPRRDLTGKAKTLVKIMEEEYAKTTGFSQDPNITRGMTGYYAFSWRRFTHAIHPMTPAVILETGFLTNPSEARSLINHPEIPAQAIAKAVLAFLTPEG